MHRITPLARPVTTPNETVLLEYLDNAWVHVTLGTHLIGFHIEVDSYPPTVCGQFVTTALQPEIETSPVGHNLPLELLLYYLIEDRLEHIP